MHLGLDLGTSSLKGMLIDGDQRILVEKSVPIIAARPFSGWSEQDPMDWICAVEDVLGGIGAQIDLSGLKSIGLSGQMHGATMLDKADKVIRPCILWNDTRSYEEARLMDRDPDFRRISGNIVFPGFTAPKLAWVRNHEPEVFRRVTKVLLPKDYLRLWLTGEHVSEMSDAAGTSWLDTSNRRWSEVLLEKTGLALEHMPYLVEGSEVSGTLRERLCVRYGIKSKVVVAGGGGDNAASGVGMGIVKPGDAFVSIGTSGVLFAACEGFRPDAKSAVHTFCHAIPNRWHQMGVILSATDSLNWYSRLVGKDLKGLVSGLGPLQAPNKTLFLPYLGGERTPHNDANIRGAFLGLEHVTDTDSGLRSVLEGVVHGFRDNFDALRSTGTEINRIIAIGGGSKSEYWLSALATSLNTPIDVPIAGDFGGAFGAARLGMLSAGAGEEIIVPPDTHKTINPERHLISAFADAHAQYREAYKLIKVS